jgi:hypothetical protein
VKEWSHDLNWSALWKVNDVKRSIQDQSDVLCGSEQMTEDNVQT